MDHKWLPPAKRARQDYVGSSVTKDLNDEQAQAFPNSGSGLDSSTDGLGLEVFQVLDEVGSDDPDNVREADTDDSEIPASEIERMLDERLPSDFRIPLKEKEGLVMKQKTVLDVKGQQFLEVLPLDWVMVTHTSGMPVYLHKGLRVCTLARPYFLGEGSVRRHEIPSSAIPCLAYRRALDEEEKQKESNKTVYEEHNKTNIDGEKTCPFSGTEPREPIVEKVDYSMDITEDIYSGVMNMLEISPVGIGTSAGPTSEMYSESSSEGPTKDEQHGSVAGGPLYEIAHTSSGVSTCNNIAHTSSGVPALNEIDHSIEEPTKNEMYHSSSGGTTQEMVHSGEITNDETAAKEYNQETAVSDEFAKPPDVLIPPAKKPVVLPGGLVLPATRVVLDKWSNHTLTHEQVTEYCRKLFIFKDINYPFFKDWTQRRQYLKNRKAIQRPKLPVGPKLVSLPLPDANGESTGQGAEVQMGKAPREWTLNMNERSYVNMLYEYLTHVMHKSPKYIFRDLESSVTPFEATVVIDGIRYGVGEGGSKKQAKCNAAKETMLILVPEIKDKVEEGQDAKRANDEPNMEFFDMIGIEDPRLAEFCRTAVEPLPRAILGNCVRKNFGATGSELQYKWTKLAYNKIEYHMSVGKHSATVTCKSHRMGKQLASQALLQVLHPHIKSYGSLLRLYGSKSLKGNRGHQQEPDQDDPYDCHPNYALLEKLRRNIEKLGKMDASATPIGTLVLSDAPPSLSDSALNDIDF